MILFDELVKPSSPKANDDVEINHVYCQCDPDTSLCGLDISSIDMMDGVADDEDDPDRCVVCDEMMDKNCPQCGD